MLLPISVSLSSLGDMCSLSFVIIYDMEETLRRAGVVADVISKQTFVGRLKSRLMVIVIVILEVSVCL